MIKQHMSSLKLWFIVVVVVAVWTLPPFRCAVYSHWYWVVVLLYNEH